MSEFATRRVAIVAALEREVRPLVKHWRVREGEYGGRIFRFFEDDDVVLVCGGIGVEAARRASEAVISLYRPELILSAGFAGALHAELSIGDVFQPRRVVNAGDGSCVNLGRGEGVLVTFGSVASPEQKAKLRESFAAQAVDMEASAVARAAEARNVKFAAVKAISDELDFSFPEMEKFIDADGRFSEMRFAAFVAVRPWLWWSTFQLARNGSRAATALCAWLRQNAGQFAHQSERSDLHQFEAAKQ